MKILIIKLGALGDVLRTTPLLSALKKKYPSCQITWIVDAPHKEILETNPLIDQLRDSSQATSEWLKNQSFDLAVNLDKEPEATAFLVQANAIKKMGFSQSAEGRLCPADSFSDYAYQLGFDDDLKFRKNNKTYQQISFEQLGLTFSNEEYIFSVDENSAKEAQESLKRIGFKKAVGQPIIGLNTGSGARFAGKKLPIETLAQLAIKINDEMRARVFLLGGKDEESRNQWIEQKTKGVALNTGAHPIKRFAAIVQQCDAVITGDTTAMHIAIAVKTPVLAYFASTCAQEIEMYGRGRKIVSQIDCAPCYKKNCPIDEQCMKDIEVNQIFQELKALLS